MDVCLDCPDPDSELLNQILGQPLVALGPVSVERRSLPNFGSLVGTTEGLLFLPRLRRRENGAWEGTSPQRPQGWWPFRDQPGSPRFLKWFGGSPESNSSPLPITESSVLERDSLVDCLMDSPGAFFLEHRLTHSIKARRQQVRIDRTPLRSVTFVDETSDGSLHAALTSLATRAATDRRRPTL